MANIETALNARLKAHAGLSALVSTRVYPNHAPQSPTYPLVIHSHDSTDRVSAMASDTGNVSSIHTVSAIAETYTAATAAAVQVLAALQRYSGTSDTVVIADAFVIDEDHSFDPDLDVWILDIDFLVWYSE